MVAISRSSALAARRGASAAPPTLRLDSRGPAVVTLQKKLKAAGFDPGAADGAFGQKTLAAVKAFQKAHGLTADGVVGPKTWNKLNVKKQGPTPPAPGGGRSVTGYVKGKAQQITLSSIPNGKEMRSDAAAAFNRMHATASSAGINLHVNSGFRSMEEQRALYQKHLNGTGNLAARPGYSNHQGGIAVDVTVGATSSATYKWMENNAKRFGFIRTVPSEPWHWEFRP
ncbi:D-alanyl-D-alanine carboxypeptidase family protein [Archangium violaceum]|uniref:peptidoglycan-binding protein n=1 Tax=Archangium violaceum TaxID=83451 RepID=UPI00195132CE|nr:peptidoglycan-binding protein [Archangium violaceum]QRN95620.1 D-alanyl-D-alanine carboxypeptidase family protein [Archangium violaceum]